jgi:hypothetical protein
VQALRQPQQRFLGDVVRDGRVVHPAENKRANRAA